MTTEAAAVYLLAHHKIHVWPRHIARLAQAGKLTGATKPGRDWDIPAAALDTWARTGKHTPGRAPTPPAPSGPTGDTR